MSNINRTDEEIKPGNVLNVVSFVQPDTAKTAKQQPANDDMAVLVAELNSRRDAATIDVLLSLNTLRASLTKDLQNLYTARMRSIRLFSEYQDMRHKSGTTAQQMEEILWKLFRANERVDKLTRRATATESKIVQIEVEYLTALAAK